MLELFGIRFLEDASQAGSVLLECDHDMILAALSWVIACIAGYVALQVAHRIRAAEGGRRVFWVGLCGLAMGCGIWSMHFLGMLAYRAPIQISYDWPLTLLSLLVAIVGTSLAILFVNRGALRGWKVLAGGLFMGLAITCMHYTGMAAIISEGYFLYDPALFLYSVGIAIGASSAALYLTHLVRRVPFQYLLTLRVCAAIVMGFAVAGMHYTGMAAANLYVTRPLTELMPPLGTNVPLAVSIAGLTLAILIIALLSELFGRRLDSEAIRLRNTVFRYDQILESVPDGILLINESLMVNNANHAAMRLFDIGHLRRWPSMEQLVPGLDVLHFEDSRATHERFLEAEAISRKGRAFPIELSVSRLRSGDEQLIVVVCRDISARKRAEAHIQKLLQENQRLATTDSLTGLPNRRWIVEVLENEISRCRRYGHDLALLLVDIDHFKRINDRYGHDSGDQALRVMARILRAIARDSDIVCRYGGEEFVLALPETGLRAAAVVAERLLHRVAETEIPLKGGAGPLRMTCSIGLAPWCVGMQYDGLLNAADKMLYQAKESGRNRVVIAEHPRDPDAAGGAGYDGTDAPGNVVPIDRSK